MAEINNTVSGDWLNQAWQEGHGQPMTLACPDIISGLKVIAPVCTDSTNKLLWNLRHQGYQPPLVAIAREQTTGQGQWGRSWHSAPGGLYLSLWLETNLPAANSPHLVLWSAWGIAHALVRHGIPVRLKWPNDLLLQGKKLAGIKTESKISEGIITNAIIGVGINWINPPPATGIALGPFCEAESIDSLTNLTDLAEITLAGLTLGWQRYQRQGISAILADYLQLFAHRGREISWANGLGIIETITPQGELVVLVNQGRAIIPPGAISLGY
ncbi:MULTISPECIES: biotin--[acetyl-CoA-carboxylase] ligase [unclassified Synechocystis]|uniref:biotin--[acetyl-CoA-carboxylase] ligase n=1 Tax=unclassified Synechocystis TaxID=2640012 RepID=UPI00041EA975|nr:MULTISPECIES: biotin--[acetyl-CoA-carboxylase] ligase [unclassified Synechocystis]AIE73076.1 Biotin-protein ligase [Synechocystis sp. PCC 6714]MCT0254394.1 biotin--[acetyl-CoA-carboxylase] ligase [Synechocystis sp. CS-94]